MIKHRNNNINNDIHSFIPGIYIAPLQ